MAPALWPLSSLPSVPYGNLSADCCHHSSSAGQQYCRLQYTISCHWAAAAPQPQYIFVFCRWIKNYLYFWFISLILNLSLNSEMNEKSKKWTRNSQIQSMILKFMIINICKFWRLKYVIMGNNGTHCNIDISMSS